MSDILKKYEESTTAAVVSARNQSDGDQTTAVNFFDIESTYQDNFTTRDRGSKTVTLSNADDATAGNFTKEALSHYNQEVVDLAGKHHKYNRSKNDSHYVNKNLDARGVSYQSSISEK